MVAATQWLRELMLGASREPGDDRLDTLVPERHLQDRPDLYVGIGAQIVERPTQCAGRYERLNLYDR
jgi:hypothetical protein